MHYEYDLADRLKGTSDDWSDYTFEYDGIGRLKEAVTDLPGLSDDVTLTALFDKGSNRTKLSATIGSTADFINDYVYDSQNRMSQVSQSEALVGNDVLEKRVDFAYNLAGQFDAIDRYSDLAGTTLVAGSLFTYDEAGRLTRIQHDRGSGWVAHAYTYDENNRVTSYENLIPTGNWDAPVEYDYDDTNQLTGEDTWNSYQDNAYEYDLAGNRTEKDGTAQTVVAGNRVTSDGTYTYAYDEEGNLVKRTDASGNERALVYDFRNRLVEVKDYTGTILSGTLRQHVKYEYDTLNRRVATWLDTNHDGNSDREEFYIYDGDDVVLDFVDANGATGGLSPAPAMRYLHGPAVDQILAQEDINKSPSDDDRTLWMLTDQLGSVRDIVDNAGNGVSHISYDGFGNIVGGTVLLTRYLWTGREFDTSTGLQYNRNRWYDPTLGRWVSEDPIGFSGGDYNLNRYVGNTSTGDLDPGGLAGKCGGLLPGGPSQGGPTLSLLTPNLPPTHVPMWMNAPMEDVGEVVANVEGHDQMIQQMRSFGIANGLSRIMTLNLTGHGGRGLSVDQLFDPQTLTPEEIRDIRNLMDPRGAIIIHSCDSGNATSDLASELANQLGVKIIYGYNGSGYGPFDFRSTWWEWINGGGWKVASPNVKEPPFPPPNWGSSH